MIRRRVLGLACIVLLVVALVPLIWYAPPPEQKEFGRYTVVKVGGIRPTWPTIYNLLFEGTGDRFCPPRQELYFERTHLATCETPSGLMVGPPQPIPDPFCFAIAPDDSSASYWHETEYCGAGTRPLTKAPGVYFHSTAEGERRLYATGDGVHQLWGGEPAAGGIIIGLGYPKGFRVVGPDGVERVEISHRKPQTEGR